MADDASLDFLGNPPTEAREPKSAKEHLANGQKKNPRRLKRVKRTLTLEVTQKDVAADRYVPRKISFQLDGDTARGIQRLLHVLREDRTLQRNGRNVSSVHDAIRYLVEEFVGDDDD